MTKQEIIQNLNVVMSIIQWQYPINYCVAIQEAKKLINKEQDEQTKELIDWMQLAKVNAIYNDWQVNNEQGQKKMVYRIIDEAMKSIKGE